MVAVNSCVQVCGFHTKRSLNPNHAAEPAPFAHTSHSSWHLLAVREVNNCVEEGAGYRDNLRQAVLSPLLPSRVGGWQAPCLRFFQAHQLHRQGGRGEWQISHNWCVLWKARKYIPAPGWGETRARALCLYLTGTTPAEGEKEQHVQRERLLSDKPSISPATLSIWVHSQQGPHLPAKGCFAQACCPCCRCVGVKEASLKNTRMHTFSSLPRFWSSWVPCPSLILPLTSTSISLSCSRKGDCSKNLHYCTFPSGLQGVPAVHTEGLEFANWCISVLLVTVRTQFLTPCLLPGQKHGHRSGTHTSTAVWGGHHAGTAGSKDSQQGKVDGMSWHRAGEQKHGYSITSADAFPVCKMCITGRHILLKWCEITAVPSPLTSLPYKNFDSKSVTK